MEFTYTYFQSRSLNYIAYLPNKIIILSDDFGRIRLRIIILQFSIVANLILQYHLDVVFNIKFLLQLIKKLKKKIGICIEVIIFIAAPAT